VPSFVDVLAAPDVFCAFLLTTGRKARRVESAPELDRGFFSQDKTIVALERSPIDFITLRAGPPRLRGPGDATLTLGALPLLATRTFQIGYHYIVRTRFAYPMLDTKLVQERRSLFDRTRVGISWSGKFLGPKIAGDADVMKTLLEHTRPDDRLSVRAEPKRGIVRIIHERLCTFEYNLFAEAPIRWHKEQIAPPLLDAIDRIAERVRQPMAS
jgi:hypothetical protein